MADPKATPVDTDNQLIQTEAALRRANRDQIDAATLMEAEDAPPCTFWRKLRRQCTPGETRHEVEEADR